MAEKMLTHVRLLSEAASIPNIGPNTRVKIEELKDLAAQLQDERMDAETPEAYQALVEKHNEILEAKAKAMGFE